MEHLSFCTQKWKVYKRNFWLHKLIYERIICYLNADRCVDWHIPHYWFASRLASAEMRGLTFKSQASGFWQNRHRSRIRSRTVLICGTLWCRSCDLDLERKSTGWSDVRNFDVVFQIQTASASVNTPGLLHWLLISHLSGKYNSNKFLHKKCRNLCEMKHRKTTMTRLAFKWRCWIPKTKSWMSVLTFWARGWNERPHGVIFLSSLSSSLLTSSDHPPPCAKPPWSSPRVSAKSSQRLNKQVFTSRCVLHWRHQRSSVSFCGAYPPPNCQMPPCQCVTVRPLLNQVNLFLSNFNCQK